MATGTITQLRRGVLGPCVLALLARGPRYGLELARELERAGELLTSQGTLYPLLGRLHDAELVTSRWEVGDTDRPRRYYEITEAGRRELAEFGREWAAFAGAVSAVVSEPQEEES